MNRKTAYKILNISQDVRLTQQVLKSQYRIHALMYHPDKNKSPDAQQRFQEVQEAYEYLHNELDSSFSPEKKDDIMKDYKSILQFFVESLKNYAKNKDILDKIVDVCETQTIQFLEKLDDLKLKFIYQILTKYRHIFYLSNEFYESLEEIYSERIQHNDLSNNSENEEECEKITIFPSLDDIWDHMLYKITKEEEIYLVPMWHHQLTYEHNNVDFIVNIVPRFPNEVKEDDSEDDDEENIYWIDAENNLHQKKVYSICFFLEKARKKEKMVVAFGKRYFEFPPDSLYIVPYQTWKWPREGIPKIQEKIYDTSTKSDVFLHIYLC